ncbi:MAG: citrate synthase, partial [Oscillospiraceae bacterium]
MYNEEESKAAVKILCDEFKKYNHIDPALYEKYNVKRGLRNSDGTGVMAGLTQICNVHGYIINEGEFTPIPGQLFYRGYDVVDIVKNAQAEERFGFEEVIYLLVFGSMPNKAQLGQFTETISAFMHLPDSFFDDMILKAPSSNIMNKLARAILALYSYDDDADNTSLESEIDKALHTIARMTNIMVKAYQVRRRYYENKTMFLHPLKYGLSVAEEILSLLRVDREYTKDEALLLDMCLILHAEHGGGNNSTFACRVLSSSGTDAYSAYAAAIGSLKGPKHGGANIKVLEMLMNIEENVADIRDKGQVTDYLKKIIKKEANDKTGLIYGMGHAVYTVSDPRAIVLRDKIETMIGGTEFEDEFNLLKTIEEVTPKIFIDEKGNPKPICANVDLYSGLVYKMLKIPMELFTPIFATSRIAGWGAHRIEE